MILFLEKRKNTFLHRAIALCIVMAFSFSLIVPPQAAYAQQITTLPVPGMMVNLSPAFTPVMLKGIKIYPEDPFKFDFIVDSGHSGLEGEELKKESEKLIKYFLATLTIPEEDLWVNLSPYEKDRIIPEGFGITEMGRDLLAQDYMLKQLTASLIYPEDELGQKFWDRVYKRAFAQYGTTEIAVNTFNKVWVLPDKAVVDVIADTAFVTDSHLEVLMEKDYVAREAHLVKREANASRTTLHASRSGAQDISSSIIQELIIPEIEKEVNTGKNFAQLRQIYSSLILAAWYKRTLKESILGQLYVDQGKIAGIDVEDKQAKEKIYQKYLEAYKKGVYNFIREDYDEYTDQVLPRKYFSGGANLMLADSSPGTTDMAVKDKLTVNEVQGPRSVLSRALRKVRNGFLGVALLLGVNLVNTDAMAQVKPPRESPRVTVQDKQDKEIQAKIDRALRILRRQYAQDPNVDPNETFATDSLVILGQNAIPQLIKLLDDPMFGVKEAALNALRRILKDIKSPEQLAAAKKKVLPAVKKLKDTKNVHVRVAVFNILNQFDPPVDDPQYEIMRDYLNYFTAPMYARGSTAIEFLILFTNHRDVGRRDTAYNLIGNIASELKPNDKAVKRVLSIFMKNLSLPLSDFHVARSRYLVLRELTKFLGTPLESLLEKEKINEAGMELVKSGYLYDRNQTTSILNKLKWKPKNDAEWASYLLAKKNTQALIRVGEPAVEVLIGDLERTDFYGLNSEQDAARRVAYQGLAGIYVGIDNAEKRKKIWEALKSSAEKNLKKDYFGGELIVLGDVAIASNDQTLKEEVLTLANKVREGSNAQFHATTTKVIGTVASTLDRSSSHSLKAWTTVLGDTGNKAGLINRAAIAALSKLSTRKSATPQEKREAILTLSNLLSGPSVGPAANAIGDIIESMPKNTESKEFVRDSVVDKLTAPLKDKNLRSDIIVIDSLTKAGLLLIDEKGEAVKIAKALSRAQIDESYDIKARVATWAVIKNQPSYFIRQAAIKAIAQLVAAHKNPSEIIDAVLPEYEKYLTDRDVHNQVHGFDFYGELAVALQEHPALVRKHILPKVEKFKAVGLRKNDVQKAGVAALGKVGVGLKKDKNLQKDIVDPFIKEVNDLSAGPEVYNALAQIAAGVRNDQRVLARFGIIPIILGRLTNAFDKHHSTTALGVYASHLNDGRPDNLISDVITPALQKLLKTDRQTAIDGFVAIAKNIPKSHPEYALYRNIAWRMRAHKESSIPMPADQAFDINFMIDLNSRGPFRDNAQNNNLDADDQASLARAIDDSFKRNGLKLADFPDARLTRLIAFINKINKLKDDRVQADKDTSVFHSLHSDFAGEMEHTRNYYEMYGVYQFEGKTGKDSKGAFRAAVRNLKIKKISFHRHGGINHIFYDNGALGSDYFTDKHLPNADSYWETAEDLFERAKNNNWELGDLTMTCSSCFVEDWATNVLNELGRLDTKKQIKSNPDFEVSGSRGMVTFTKAYWPNLFEEAEKLPGKTLTGRLSSRIEDLDEVLVLQDPRRIASLTPAQWDEYLDIMGLKGKKYVGPPYVVTYRRDGKTFRLSYLSPTIRSLVTRIGKRAEGEVTADKKLKITDSSGETHIRDLKSKGSFDIGALKAQFDAMDDVVPNYKAQLLEVLSRLETSPPEFNTFGNYTSDAENDIVDDLLGASSPADNLVALHESIADNPIAQFHELGEFLFDKEYGILDFEFNQTSDKEGELIVRNKSGLQIGEAIALTGRPLEYVLENPEDNHYLLRAWQRQVFGNRDKDLTLRIQGLQDEGLAAAVRTSAPGDARQSEIGEVSPRKKRGGRDGGDSGTAPRDSSRGDGKGLSQTVKRTVFRRSLDQFIARAQKTKNRDQLARLGLLFEAISKDKPDMLFERDLGSAPNNMQRVRYLTDLNTSVRDAARFVYQAFVGENGEIPERLVGLYNEYAAIVLDLTHRIRENSVVKTSTFRWEDLTNEKEGLRIDWMSEAGDVEMTVTASEAIDGALEVTSLKVGGVIFQIVDENGKPVSEKILFKKGEELKVSSAEVSDEVMINVGNQFYFAENVGGQKVLRKGRGFADESLTIGRTIKHEGDQFSINTYPSSTSDTTFERKALSPVSFIFLEREESVGIPYVAPTHIKFPNGLTLTVRQSLDTGGFVIADSKGNTVALDDSTPVMIGTDFENPFGISRQETSDMAPEEISISMMAGAIVIKDFNPDRKLLVVTPHETDDEKVVQENINLLRSFSRLDETFYVRLIRENGAILDIAQGVLYRKDALSRGDVVAQFHPATGQIQLSEENIGERIIPPNFIETINRFNQSPYFPDLESRFAVPQGKRGDAGVVPQGKPGSELSEQLQRKAFKEQLKLYFASLIDENGIAKKEFQYPALILRIGFEDKLDIVELNELLHSDPDKYGKELLEYGGRAGEFTIEHLSRVSGILTSTLGSIDSDDSAMVNIYDSLVFAFREFDKFRRKSEQTELFEFSKTDVTRRQAIKMHTVGNAYPDFELRKSPGVEGAYELINVTYVNKDIGGFVELDSNGRRVWSDRLVIDTDEELAVFRHPEGPIYVIAGEKVFRFIADKNNEILLVQQEDIDVDVDTLGPEIRVRMSGDDVVLEKYPNGWFEKFETVDLPEDFDELKDFEVTVAEGDYIEFPFLRPVILNVGGKTPLMLRKANGDYIISDQEGNEVPLEDSKVSKKETVKRLYLGHKASKYHTKETRAKLVKLNLTYPEIENDHLSVIVDNNIVRVKDAGTTTGTTVTFPLLEHDDTVVRANVRMLDKLHMSYGERFDNMRVKNGLLVSRQSGHNMRFFPDMRIFQWGYGPGEAKDDIRGLHKNIRAAIKVHNKKRGIKGTGDAGMAPSTPFPKLTAESSFTARELLNEFSTKYGIRNILRGGPIRQPDYFAAVKRDERELNVLKQIEGRRPVEDLSYTPLFATPSDEKSFEDIVDGLISGDINLPIIFKPNDGAFGSKIFRVERSSEKLQEYVVTLAYGTDHHEIVEQSNAFKSQFEKQRGIKIKPIEKQNIMRLTIDSSVVSIKEALVRAWKIMAKIESDVGPAYDSGMVESLMPVALYKPEDAATEEEFAFETRHGFRGDLTGGFRHLKGRDESFARIGTSAEFSNQSGRAKNELPPDEMFNPLFEMFNIPQERQAEFVSYVDDLIAQEFQYLVDRLKQAGIILDTNVYGEFDLMWLKETDDRGFPVPVLIEALAIRDGEQPALRVSPVAGYVDEVKIDSDGGRKIIKGANIHLQFPQETVETIEVTGIIKKIPDYGFSHVLMSNGQHFRIEDVSEILVDGGRGGHFKRDKGTILAVIRTFLENADLTRPVTARSQKAITIFENERGEVTQAPSDENGHTLKYRTEDGEEKSLTLDEIRSRKGRIYLVDTGEDSASPAGDAGVVPEHFKFSFEQRITAGKVLRYASILNSDITSRVHLSQFANLIKAVATNTPELLLSPGGETDDPERALERIRENAFRFSVRKARRMVHQVLARGPDKAVEAYEVYGTIIDEIETIKYYDIVNLNGEKAFIPVVEGLPVNLHFPNQNVLSISRSDTQEEAIDVENLAGEVMTVWKSVPLEIKQHPYHLTLSAKLTPTTEGNHILVTNEGRAGIYLDEVSDSWTRVYVPVLENEADIKERNFSMLHTVVQREKIGKTVDQGEGERNRYYIHALLSNGMILNIGRDVPVGDRFETSPAIEIIDGLVEIAGVSEETIDPLLRQTINEFNEEELKKRSGDSDGDAGLAVTSDSNLAAGVGQHPVGEEDFSSDEIKQLLESAKMYGIQEATLDKRKQWAATLRAHLSLDDDVKKLFRDEAKLPGMKEAFETLVDLLDGNETDRVKRINETPFRILFTDSIDEYATETGKYAGAFTVVDKETGRKDIYVRQSKEINYQGLDGVVHELMEHLVLPSDPRFRESQYHTIAFFAEGLLENEVAKDFKENTVAIPSRVTTQFEFYLVGDDGLDRLAKFISPNTTNVINEINKMKFPRDEDKPYREYAIAMANVLKQKAIDRADKAVVEAAARVLAADTTDEDESVEGVDLPGIFRDIMEELIASAPPPPPRWFDPETEQEWQELLTEENSLTNRIAYHLWTLNKSGSQENQEEFQMTLGLIAGTVDNNLGAVVGWRHLGSRDAYEAKRRIGDFKIEDAQEFLDDYRDSGFNPQALKRFDKILDTLRVLEALTDPQMGDAGVAVDSIPPSELDDEQGSKDFAKFAYILYLRKDGWAYTLDRSEIPRLREYFGFSEGFDEQYKLFLDKIEDSQASLGRDLKENEINEVARKIVLGDDIDDDKSEIFLREFWGEEYLEKIREQRRKRVEPYMQNIIFGDSFDGAGGDSGQAIGGINFNPSKLKIEVRKDEKGMPIPLSPQQIQNININGLMPVIINVTPITNFPMLLGEVEEDRNDRISGYRDTRMKDSRVSEYQENT